MKVPFSWLKEFVDIDVTAQELEEKLFSCGFEVEELIPLDAGISKVVVGKIVEMEKQEGTHLTKCVVDCGDYGHDIRISTGAANMKLGDCVPAALDGSTLPGGIKIKARKMQGVESNGMLCSGEELGLNDDLFPGSEVYGLLILPEDSVPGTDIAPVVGLDDYIFDISITANRPDCQSVLGIAREVAAILGKPCTCPPWITRLSASRMHPSPSRWRPRPVPPLYGALRPQHPHGRISPLDEAPSGPVRPALHQQCGGYHQPHPAGNGPAHARL